MYYINFYIWISRFIKIEIQKLHMKLFFNKQEYQQNSALIDMQINLWWLTSIIPEIKTANCYKLYKCKQN